MNGGWKEILWKSIQDEMDKFAKQLADNPKDLDDYQESDQKLLKHRISELERVGGKTEDTAPPPPPDRTKTKTYKFLHRADLLVDIRAMQYLRLVEKDRRKRHRVSKGFRKAYDISLRDLGEIMCEAPRQVIEAINKRADLIFNNLDKLYPEKYEEIYEKSEFILDRWLDDKEYPEDVVKIHYSLLAKSYDGLKDADWGNF